jgi:hypothetical protein
MLVWSALTRGLFGLSKAATMLARSSLIMAKSVAPYSPQEVNGPSMKEELMSHPKAMSLKEVYRTRRQLCYRWHGEPYYTRRHQL